MTTDELALCWVPIPLRWRHVQPGDVIIGSDGTPWMVTQPVVDASERGVRIVQYPDRQWCGDVDPDETVHVLVPLSERDALTTARDELAARVIERRTT